METDTLGAVDVSGDRLWGAQTQRSLTHFAIGEDRMPMAIVRALVMIKRAAALANARLGEVRPDIAQAILGAADEVLGGAWDDEFPLSVWQTGSGTQTNMNVNEVLANRASEIMGGGRGMQRCVHPNDHVNRCQSSNDVFPTAMHVAAVMQWEALLLPALRQLRQTLQDKSAAFDAIIKLGRTHLQDATPLTLGQEFSGYGAQLALCEGALAAAQKPLYALGLGGTAVGTGINAPPQFAQ
jgi:fumarate hydratase class II